MRIALLLGLAGCWTAASPAQAPVANVEPAAATPPAEARAPFPRHSVWRGTYRCTQGVTAVTLTIDAEPDGDAIARYDFGPVPENPSVPPGSYELAGVLRVTERGFTGAFTPVRWLDQPTNYMMVGIAVTARGDQLRGTFDLAACRDLRARRVR